MPSLSPWCNTALALAAVAVPAAAQAPSPTFSDAVYPTGIERDGEQWLCFRAVDALTGAPLPAAELFLIAESLHPVRGEFAAERRITADADGFVRVRNDRTAPDHRHWSWALLRAPGHGQLTQMNSLDGVVALAPAIDLPLELVDWFERPVADCLVGFCCGCGHTPDVTWARSDQDGRCVLRGIDNRQGIRDLYLEHPRLGLLYDDRDWLPGEPPVRIVAPRGHASQGVVVDEHGKPVEGAFVGVPECHRGPWTRTGADGSFLLYGTEQIPDELFVHLGERQILVEVADTAPLRLQLPPTPPAEFLKRPGHTEFVQRQQGERAGPTGRDARPLWPDEHAPTVTVRTVDLPADAGVTLVTEAASHDLRDLLASGAPVPLPDEPFAFVLGTTRGPHRTLHYTRQQALAEGVVRLRWFRPTRIEGRVVGPDGAPREASLRLLDPREALDLHFATMHAGDATAGAIALETDREGLAVLQVVDREGRLPTRLVPILLPPRGDDVAVDLGAIALDERAPYLLHGADGELLDDWQVALLRPGWIDTEHIEHVRLHIEGHAPLPDLQAGDVLHVEPLQEQPQLEDGKAVYRVPARFAVTGQGPWDFTLPSGELWLRVRCDDAPDAEIVLFVDDLQIDVEEPLLLRGLTIGRHRLFVCAAGHQTAIVDVDVPAVGMAELDLKLPPR